jgi:hypothetical protein
MNAMNGLAKVLPEIKKQIAGLVVVAPGLTGLSIGRRVQQKLETFLESYKQAGEYLGQAKAVAAKAGSYAQEDLKELSGLSGAGTGAVEKSGSEWVKGLQVILFTQGFPKGDIWSGKITGIMDEDTAKAAAELEERMDDMFRDRASRMGLKGSFRGGVVSGGKVMRDPQRLQRLLKLIEKPS